WILPETARNSRIITPGGSIQHGLGFKPAEEFRRPGTYAQRIGVVAADNGNRTLVKNRRVIKFSPIHPLFE
ncbi:MAG: hypothetical protein OEN49_04370, partial [Gammaproteobacteria bacterium]|nr:hypothetical protein [Gammaproteobacteria bacterium]